MVAQIRSRRETQLVGVFMHPSGAMEMRFRKPSFKYKSGQWLFIQVPEISRWQWCAQSLRLYVDDRLKGVGLEHPQYDAEGEHLR